ncbi:P-loop containing nucleoside triphosphate hydrolase protein [Gonapodya prolifera JEL478]|uniref:p-loop containing nucleoside triphosphate hydrolase protein n=1 Tax=Gonapodya prolifera (strain JEL478) TaxID=1344416 RepID=A0A139A541_GONPJ|nr:P-loop containing nucleoside triphosphate hydrolase protein [Gonapodya prolifera JEL478]|eukprot:KXS11739.1 P-loop containing nucleoside triphosphate hydrolase protein [Gonapodya prolifera JEL478]
MKTTFRIALTGTPMQNNLEEYYHMINFVIPDFLGPKSGFLNFYRTPIEVGSYANASPAEKRAASVRMKALQEDVAPFIQRFEQNEIKSSLPDKTDSVLSLRLTSVQHRLYVDVLERIKTSGFSNFGGMVLAMVHPLSHICAHPIIFYDGIIKSQKRRGVNATSSTVNDDETRSDIPGEDPSNLQGLDDVMQGNTVMAEVPPEATLNDVLMGVWGASGLSELVPSLEQSWKMRIVLNIVQVAKKLGDKTLVFSNHIPVIDYLVRLFEQNDIRLSCLDGRVSTKKRQALVDAFNSGNDVDVFLITPKTGGLGLNFQEANRVILCDYDWNPTYGEQAVARAYRFGQKKHVHVYRLTSGETIEWRVFDNNVRKIGIALRLVDKKRVEHNVNEDDLKAYFRAPPENPISKVPDHFRMSVKDEVLADALERFEHGILDVHCADVTAKLKRLQEEGLLYKMELQPRRRIWDQAARVQPRCKLQPKCTVQRGFSMKA